jgi:hypothetical protein
MALGPQGARGLISVAAFGLLCALGAAGATAGVGSERASSSGTAACPSKQKCKPPKWYRFEIGGTTDYRYGGTETWSMRGKMRYVRPTPIRVEYWQASGTVTLTFKDIGWEYPRDDCAGMGYFNAPTQTIRLLRNDVDVNFVFRPTSAKYEVSTRASRDENRGAHGTWTCPDGLTFPGLEAHKWTGIWTHRGLPRRVVKGRGSYLSRDLERYRFHWKLTALNAGG